MTKKEEHWEMIFYKKHYERMYRMFSEVMESVSEGILVIDRKRTVIHANGAAAKLLEVKEHELIGKSLEVYFQPEEPFSHLLKKLTRNSDIKQRIQFGETNLECQFRLVRGQFSANEEDFVIVRLGTAKTREYRKDSADRMARVRFGDIRGKSEGIKEAIRMGKIAAKTSSNVLILGETGTGKNLFAQAIHNYSLQREEPFAVVNCGRLGESLAENRIFERAEGGTLFLDEIGDLPVRGQESLLWALRDAELTGRKSDGTGKNVRIIAATNKEMDQLIKKNMFRKDLYYRLNVFPLNIPSLIERKKDILLLSNHFIKKYSVVSKKTVNGISPETARLFLDYDWPGNVRELENVVKRAVDVTRTNVLRTEDLPFYLRGKHKASPQETKKEDGNGNLNKVQQLEKAAIVDTLKEHKGNISKTAEILGINRRTLHRRMGNYGIDAKQYKGQ